MERRGRLVLRTNETGDLIHHLISTRMLDLLVISHYLLKKYTLPYIIA